MPDKREKLLRIVCIVLGGVVALQLALFAVHASFSRGLTVPALPSLPPETEAQTGKGANTPSATNASTLGTNALAKGTTNAIGTNASAARSQMSNSPSPGISVTNGGHSKIALTGTNGLPEVVKQEMAGAASNRSSTNASNVVAVVDKTLTNSSASKGISKKGPPGGRSGSQSKIADLPAPIKERIDRITQGEILAPVMRPLPMALLGIAGQSAFLRGPDGQTGLVKEGDQLGTLKLLRIGTNRVLVEQDGEKKELMIFAGLGSESLLPKPDKTTNEPAKKSP